MQIPSHNTSRERKKISQLQRPKKRGNKSITSPKKKSQLLQPESAVASARTLVE